MIFVYVASSVFIYKGAELHVVFREWVQAEGRELFSRSWHVDDVRDVPNASSATSNTSRFDMPREFIDSMATQ
jgi:hypothetical protein